MSVQKQHVRWAGSWCPKAVSCSRTQPIELWGTCRNLAVSSKITGNTREYAGEMAVQAAVPELQQNSLLCLGAQVLNQITGGSKPNPRSLGLYTLMLHVDSENTFHKILSGFKFIICLLTKDHRDYLQSSSQCGKLLKALDLMIHFMLFSTWLFLLRWLIKQTNCKKTSQAECPVFLLDVKSPSFSVNDTRWFWMLQFKNSF